MKNNVLASKKNVIILSAIAVSIVLMLGSYYSKRSQIQKKTALGGQIQLVTNGPLSGPEYVFVRGSAAKLSYVADMKTPLPLPGGLFVSNVRGFDGDYPLHGAIKFNKMNNKIIFIADSNKQLFGVAVNQLFLDQTGMKLNDIFTMNKKKYQLRAIIESLPDLSGQAMNKEPLLMLRDYVEVGNGMWRDATQHNLRYNLSTKKYSSQQFEKEFKKRFPASKTVIKSADAQ